MNHIKLFFLFFLSVSPGYGLDFHVDIKGNDRDGNGSKEKPWRTVAYAIKKIPANQSHTLRISSGMFYENAAIEIPAKVNLVGAGIDLTIIKASKSFYYNPASPDLAPDKFLIRLDGPENTHGDQHLKAFTIDGASKHLHGGIYVHGRDNILIENIKVQYTNFCGVWILKTENSTVRKVSLVNCAWGNTDWCSGALQFAYTENVEFDQLTIDEDKGYGIKTLGQSKDHVLKHFKLHDSNISVNPKGLWQNGKAPNISIEIWANSFQQSEIYNCYVDNHMSIVNTDHEIHPTGEKFRIHHNTIDLTGRAHGEGYGLELTIHDAEVDHNIFKGGMWGISNWAQPKQNWSIHHNIFYGLNNVNPGAIINAYKGNLKHVNIYNNTVELQGKATINFLECNNGGVSDDVKIQNNLIINSNTEYAHYSNRFINLEAGSTIKNLLVENNILFNMPLEKIEGTLRNNYFVDPKISRSGNRPFPFYLPASNSPLKDAGCKLDFPYNGTAPDIGAYESK